MDHMEGQTSSDTLRRSLRRPRGSAARHRRQAGFTLIEAALATVIVATGVLSILAAQQAYHRKNSWANKAGTAMLLANEIRELTFSMPLHDPITGTATIGPESGENSIDAYDDLDDFAGTVGMDKKGSGTIFIAADATWIPAGTKRMVGPVNALGNTIPDMAGWSQHVKVVSLLPENLSVIDSMSQPLGINAKEVMRVTVDVLYQAPGEEQATVFGTLSWIVTPNG